MNCGWVSGRYVWEIDKEMKSTGRSVRLIEGDNYRLNCVWISGKYVWEIDKEMNSTESVRQIERDNCIDGIMLELVEDMPGK